MLIDIPVTGANEELSSRMTEVSSIFVQKSSLCVDCKSGEEMCGQGEGKSGKKIRCELLLTITDRPDFSMSNPKRVMCDETVNN